MYLYLYFVGEVVGLCWSLLSLCLPNNPTHNMIQYSEMIIAQVSLSIMCVEAREGGKAVTL